MKSRLLVGFVALTANAGLGCGVASAAQVSAGLELRVPLACAAGDMVVGREDETSLTGSIHEGCNAPGGYDVYVQLPERAQLEDAEIAAFAGAGGLVYLGGENGPAVREREIRIAFTGAPVTSGEVIVSIIPR